MRSILLLFTIINTANSFGMTVFEPLVDSKGRTLYLIKEEKTWEAADSFCSTLFPGGRLVSIALLINDLHHDYHWGGHLTYYVGGRWSVQEMAWINTDGTRTFHPRQMCDGAGMTLGVRWKRGEIMPTCDPSRRAMYFICADSKE